MSRHPCSYREAARYTKYRESTRNPVLEVQLYFQKYRESTCTRNPVLVQKYRSTITGSITDSIKVSNAIKEGRLVGRLVQTREQPRTEIRGRVLPGQTVTRRWSANPFERHERI